MLLKAVRTKKKLSLAQLSEMTGLTKGYLSRLERGQRQPPLSTMQRLAYALEIDVAALLDAGNPDETPPSANRNIEICNVDNARKKGLKPTEGRYLYATLVHNYQNRLMSPFLMVVKKGKTEAFTHDSEEFCYVLEGQVTLFYDEESHELKAGDCFYLDSRLNHSFENTHSVQAVILAVNFNYRRF